MFDCNICSKSYTLKRNLNRHIKEKHRDLEYWLCEMRGCRGSFIRREYLKRHLIFCHKLDSVTAGRLALRAPRGDDHPEGYYEDVSEDDSVLDVLQELIDANQMESDAVIDAFDVSAFNMITGNTLRSDDINSDILGGCVSGSDVQDANVRAGEIRSGDVINDNILSGDVIGDLDLVGNVMEGLGDDAVGYFDLGGDVIVDLGGDVMDDLGDGICDETVTNVTGEELGDGGSGSDANVSGVQAGDGSSGEGDVTVDELGDGGSGSDANVSGVQVGDGSSGESDVDGDDMDDDVIVISDEEDCTDITEFQSYEKTQIVTLTFKRKVRLVNGVKVIENFGCVVHREEFIN